MLSAEQRLYSNIHQSRNGMRNICWIAGIAREIHSKGGFIQQTKNMNHMIPFKMGPSDVVPNRYGEYSEIKIHGRIRGGRHAVTGERIVEITATAVDAPSVLDLPPQAAWDHSLPKGAPSDTFTPKFGRGGLDFTQAASRAEVAGFVSGFQLKKPGTLNEKGEASGGCLTILIQQTENPDDAIPVRLMGSRSVIVATKIKIGSPVYVKDGEIRVRIKETGDPAGEDGIVPVHKYPYIHASMLYVASRNEISEQPDWALKLYRLGNGERVARKSSQSEIEKSQTQTQTHPQPENQSRHQEQTMAEARTEMTETLIDALALGQIDTSENPSPVSKEVIGKSPNDNSDDLMGFFTKK
jgi:hypothetical protein